VVGHCTSDTARILCCVDAEAAGPEALARLAWTANGQSGFTELRLTAAPPYQLAVFEIAGLPESAEVAYAIGIGGDPSPLPARRFRLLPKHRPPRVALVSCNGAFDVKDPQRRYEMWRVLRRQIDAGEVDMIVHAGDQVYADALVKRCSKMARSATEPGAALQALVKEYRRLYVEEAWKVPEVAAVLATCPSVMMWDDHDIDDGWGSNRHDDKPWRRLFFSAARRAFAEFQASLNPASIDAGSFACGFRHGDFACLFLDGRSHRLYKEGRVLGGDQLEAAQKWLLAQPATLRRLYLVLGVPPVHAKLATVLAILKWLPIREDYAADLRDAWVSPRNRGESAALMETMLNFLDTHPGTDLTILAGDVHVANIGKLERHPVEIWQVTSSGIGSPPPEGAAGWVLEKVAREPVDLGAAVQGRLLPITRAGHDLLRARNFALLKLDDGRGWDPEGALRVAFFSEGSEHPLGLLLPSRIHAS
jgi:phosphodiesterase/alkaline phosphatase D-like protein